MESLIEQVAVCDDPIKDEESTTYTVNKIGGIPKFLPNKYFNLKQCTNCDSKMVLVTQLYCPLIESTYHRVLYIMACVNPSCWTKPDSWFCYRSQEQDFDYLKQLEDEERAKQSEQSFMVSDDWGCNANEWDDSDDMMNETSETNYYSCIAEDKDDSRRTSVSSNSMYNAQSIETGLKNLAISRSSSSSLSGSESFVDSNNNKVLMDDVLSDAFSMWKKTLNIINPSPAVIQFDANMPYFQPIYLNVFQKTQFMTDKNNNRKPEKKYASDAVDADDEKAYSKPEEYEKSSLKHGDKIFHKFRKLIDYCPYQSISLETCLRYARKSNPLFIAKHDDFKLNDKNCNYCNSKCVFEFQLMPALVNYLKPVNASYNSIEFGTVIVYACKNSCWSDSDNFRSEHIYVQSDPDEKLFS